MTIAQSQYINLWGDAYGELKIDSKFNEINCIIDKDTSPMTISIEFDKYNRDINMIPNNAEVILFVRHNLRYIRETLCLFDDISAGGVVTRKVPITFGSKSNEAKWQVKIIDNDKNKSFTWAWSKMKKIEPSSIPMFGDGGSMLAAEKASGMGDVLWVVSTTNDDRPYIKVNQDCPQFYEELKMPFIGSNIVHHVISEILDSLISAKADDRLYEYSWHEKWIEWTNDFSTKDFKELEISCSDDIFNVLEWKKEVLAAFCIQLEQLNIADEHYKGDE
jgi:hypothetical protein